MLPSLAALLLAAATTASPSPATEPARTPEATLPRLAAIYEARSLGGLDDLLTADFRWHFSANDSVGSRYATGWSRERELSSARGMFVGNPGARLPPPDSIFASAGPLDIGVDPEHPDSACQYRLVIARDFAMRLVVDTMQYDIRAGAQVFHVVRGDAAVRMPGQSADTTHWYIRRWVEDLDAITVSLGAVEGECGGESGADATPSALPPGLGLRAISVPVCPTLKVLCDLPGTESAWLEVYDLMGKRLSQRELSPQAAGSRLVEAGNGKRFAPGAYWVRLTQGRRAPVTRMVMVAN